MVFIELTALLIGIVVLAKSSSVVVENAVKLTAFFGINQLVIGLLLISVSTSLPELSVSVISASANESALAAGNVFGSNIANILLILGLGAFIYGFKVKKHDLKEIALVLLLTTAISAYIIFNSVVRNQALGLTEGLILLLLFIGYLAYLFLGKQKEINGSVKKEVITKKEALVAFLYFGAAIIAVLISSGIVVEYAIKIANIFSLAESFIGATLIAIGTSLPELSVDLQAIRKKQFGLALGDAIGSNMINLTLVLGTAAVINPISVAIPIFIAALLFAVFANMLLLYFAATNDTVKKNQGVVMLATYGIYLITIFYLQIGKIV